MKKFKVICICVLLLVAILVGNINQINAQAQSTFDNMSAKSYVILDASGNVLIENKKDEKREVASICKLMTTLLTLENIDKGNITLDDKFIASKYACDIEGSQAFLDAGSEYSIRDLLKSVIVASANDSAIVLAEGLAGSESNFVELMNDKAKNLGMHNTMYSNSTGLSGQAQYSTAYDTAILLNVVSKYDIYREDCKIWLDELVHPSGRKTELVNTNRLIKYYDYCLTGKTGFTDEAGYCLSSTAEKNGMKLTCVVLGCKNSADRFKDSVQLYNYAYANFVNKQIVFAKDEIENNISIIGSADDSIVISAADDYYLTQNRNIEKEYTIQYNLPEKIKAPISSGEVVGTLQVIVDNEVIKEINLICKSDISKQTYGDVINKIINKFGAIN